MIDHIVVILAGVGIGFFIHMVANIMKAIILVLGGGEEKNIHWEH